MDSFAQLHCSLLAGELDQPSRHDLTHLVLGDVFVETGWDKLLHAQPELPLFLVDVKYLRLDHLAGAKHVLRPFDPLLRADLADVNHAFDAFGELAQTRRTS